MTGPRSEWPIVVGGCHRSGMSLVRRLPDAHPRIHCGPEVPFFGDFYGNYLGDALHHLRFTHARSLPFEDESLEILGEDLSPSTSTRRIVPESRGGPARRNRMLR